MPGTSPCPFRYIFKGRTFCAVAVRDRRYTTAEVVPGACADCRAREAFDTVRCAHLDLGVEIDQYGGSYDVNIFYASCEQHVERLTDLDRCGEQKCPLWAPVDADRVAGIREAALMRRREKDADQTQ